MHLTIFYKKTTLMKSIFRILLWMSYEGYFYFIFPEKNNQLTLQGNDTQPYGLFERKMLKFLEKRDPFYLQITLTSWKWHLSSEVIILQWFMLK